MHSMPLPGIDTRSRYSCSTSSPPVRDDDHNALEREEGEEGQDKSAGSSGFVVATLWSSPVY
jgi:hypothetical protein